MALFHRNPMKTTFTPARFLAGPALALSLALGGSAQAQPAGGEGQRPPPPEAIAACKSQPSGATCSFSGRQGTVAGTCWAPQDKALACKPKDVPSFGGDTQQPPRQ